MRSFQTPPEQRVSGYCLLVCLMQTAPSRENAPRAPRLTFDLDFAGSSGCTWPWLSSCPRGQGKPEKAFLCTSVLEALAGLLHPHACQMSMRPGLAEAHTRSLPALGSQVPWSRPSPGPGPRRLTFPLVRSRSPTLAGSDFSLLRTCTEPGPCEGGNKNNNLQAWAVSWVRSREPRHLSAHTWETPAGRGSQSSVLCRYLRTVCI